MVYRIRYKRPGGGMDSEITVEANSPTEAMVKFQYADTGSTATRPNQVVTSVRAEDGFSDILS